MMGSQSRGTAAMQMHGLVAISSCIECKFRHSRTFCNFSNDTLREFNALGHLMVYPKNAMLFVEGQPVRGAYVLCQGRVKLSTVSVRGKGLILKMAEPGAVLGLSAVTLNRPYELTAEAETACQVKYVEKEALDRLFSSQGEAGTRAGDA